MPGRIVVTGATGTIGSNVVTQLRARGADVTAFVRNPDKAAPLQAAGATLAEGSFEDGASLRAAFTAADIVVLITESNKHALVQADNALAAARECGVRKIVRVSAIRSDHQAACDNLRQHAHTEAGIIASGFSYVILRPTIFMQAVLWGMEGVLKAGQLYFGMGLARVGIIDARDIADCVVASASSAAFDNRSFELSGAAVVDFHQIAAALGRALGRSVEYIPPSQEAVVGALRGMGAEDWLCGIISDYYALYSGGWSEFTTDNVQRITGHPARSIDDFAREVFAVMAGGL